MGDRYYNAQKNYKPKRRLKVDVIAELDAVLGQHVDGMDRLTIKALDDLIKAVKERQI